MSAKNKINKFLRAFGVELHGISYLQALAKGDFKNDELEILLKVYAGNKILIYDVGANRGVMTEKYLLKFPQSQIHAFEPYPEYALMLEARYKQNSDIFINRVGISSEEGLENLNVNKNSNENSNSN